MLNRHYTAHHTADLKEAVDRADYKLRIAEHDRYGFPVIASCDLERRQPARIGITLDEEGGAEELIVQETDGGATLIDYRKGHDDLHQTAMKLNELTQTHTLTLPRNRAKRSLVESLKALGFRRQVLPDEVVC